MIAFPLKSTIRSNEKQKTKSTTKVGDCRILESNEDESVVVFGMSGVCVCLSIENADNNNRMQKKKKKKRRILNERTEKKRKTLSHERM